MDKYRLSKVAGDRVGDFRANVPVKVWDRNVPFAQNTYDQLARIATLPFVKHHVAAMPDAHLGKGSTVGAVIPTHGAIIPASVGVDIGCGMNAIRLDGVTASDLPDSLENLRSEIERVCPVGRGQFQDESRPVPGLDKDKLNSFTMWLGDDHPMLGAGRRYSLEALAVRQYGTLGGGNHFIEVCLDENNHVWVMLHSGSRGIGNAIGTYFIEKAKEDMRIHFINLADDDLAYLCEGTNLFADYVVALNWAQEYAARNRDAMMWAVVDRLREVLPPFELTESAINCHHNYVEMENHFGRNLWVTRKGAVRARVGDLGIIPGSMGAKSYIVRGKGNRESFHSCSHGAGRVMSRSQARKNLTVADHVVKATKGVECKKDASVLDEAPAAYKDIDLVMAAQEDLVEPVHTLRAVLCVKG